MATYGVARMTVRQAQGVLKAEGLAVARKGAGVFVRAAQPLRRRGTARLAQSQWGAGRSIWAADTEGRDLVVDRVTVSVEGESCVRRRRYILDGKPVQLATSYLPMVIVEGSAIMAEDTGPGGTYARLRELGSEPVRFHEEIRLGAAQADEAEALGTAIGAPVFQIRRTAYTTNDLAIEFTYMILDPASYILEYAFGAQVP